MHSRAALNVEPACSANMWGILKFCNKTEFSFNVMAITGSLSLSLSHDLLYKAAVVL